MSIYLGPFETLIFLEKMQIEKFWNMVSSNQSPWVESWKLSLLCNSKLAASLVRVAHLHAQQSTSLLGFSGTSYDLASLSWPPDPTFLQIAHTLYQSVLICFTWARLAGLSKDYSVCHFWQISPNAKTERIYWLLTKVSSPFWILVPQKLPTSIDSYLT